MKTKNLILSLLMLGSLTLAACGKSTSTTAGSTTGGGGGGSGGGSGGSGGGTTTKDVIASWNGGSGIWTLDLTSGNLNGTTFTATVTQDTGEVCDYSIQLDGNNTSGTCKIVTAGTYVGGGSGDPGCAANNVINLCGIGAATGTGSYSDNGTDLTFPNNGITFK